MYLYFFNGSVYCDASQKHYLYGLNLGRTRRHIIYVYIMHQHIIYIYLIFLPCTAAIPRKIYNLYEIKKKSIIIIIYLSSQTQCSLYIQNSYLYIIYYIV